MIQAVKRAVSLPVIGNGEIADGESAARMLEETGCDGLMVARAAQGNPWIFAQIRAHLRGEPWNAPSVEERVRTALRHAAQRSSGTTTGHYQYQDLTVDCDRRRVLLHGEDIHLTQNEYKILSLLARHSGKVLTYDQIIQHVWGSNAAGDNRILRVNMANIRRKLEANPAEPKYIFTEIGVGYRMAEGE